MAPGIAKRRLCLLVVFIGMMVSPSPHLTIMAPLLIQVPLVSALSLNGTSGDGSRKGKAAQNSYGKGEGAGVQEEEEGLLDKPLWSYVSDRITRLLREGLGDRCVLARPLCGVSGEAGEDFRGERNRQKVRKIVDTLTLSFVGTSSALLCSVCNRAGSLREYLLWCVAHTLTENHASAVFSCDYFRAAGSNVRHPCLAGCFTFAFGGYFAFTFTFAWSRCSRVGSHVPGSVISNNPLPLTVDAPFCSGVQASRGPADGIPAVVPPQVSEAGLRSGTKRAPPC